MQKKNLLNCAELFFFLLKISPSWSERKRFVFFKTIMHFCHHVVMNEEKKLLTSWNLCEIDEILSKFPHRDPKGEGTFHSQHDCSILRALSEWHEIICSDDDGGKSKFTFKEISSYSSKYIFFSASKLWNGMKCIFQHSQPAEYEARATLVRLGIYMDPTTLVWVHGEY